MEVLLSDGQSAFLDDADEGVLAGTKAWRSMPARFTTYAMSKAKIDGMWRAVYLHRLVLGLPYGDRREGDHVDRDGLNNRRANLRIASPAQNKGNTRAKGGRSAHKGVCWHKRGHKWRAECAGTYLGLFTSEIEAAEAYNRAALAHFGPFALLNDLGASHLGLAEQVGLELPRNEPAIACDVQPWAPG
jgi:hypothetical protein